MFDAEGELARRCWALCTLFLLWSVIGVGLLWAVLWHQASRPPMVLDADTAVFPGLLSAATAGTIGALGGGAVAAVAWLTGSRFASIGMGVAAAGVALPAPGWDTYPDAAELRWASVFGVALPLLLVALRLARSTDVPDFGLLRRVRWRAPLALVALVAAVAALRSAADGAGMGLVYGNVEDESGWPYLMYSVVVAVVACTLASAFARGPRCRR